MKQSKQDSVYLDTEGDSFFERNFEGKDLPELRDSKKVILEHIQNAKIEFKSVLEYGCNYADLLYYFNQEGKSAYGVEASGKAVAYAKERFNNAFEIVQGTIADNPINGSGDYLEKIDLVIIDDVFGWVSRETVFESIANIDSLISEGGYLFLRDFYPDKRVKNQNHHVADGTVFNYKVPGSHASVFLASGKYEIESQRVFFDNLGISTDYKCDNLFNYRWTDVLLKKSTNGFFDESKKL